jgi:hypothetical protein
MRTLTIRKASAFSLAHLPYLSASDGVFLCFRDSGGSLLGLGDDWGDGYDCGTCGFSDWADCGVDYSVLRSKS